MKCWLWLNRIGIVIILLWVELRCDAFVSEVLIGGAVTFIISGFFCKIVEWMVGVIFYLHIDACNVVMFYSIMLRYVAVCCSDYDTGCIYHRLCALGASLYLGYMGWRECGYTSFAMGMIIRQFHVCSIMLVWKAKVCSCESLILSDIDFIIYNYFCVLKNLFGFVLRLVL